MNVDDKAPSAVSEPARRLNELEMQWTRRFTLSPKLPTAALLSGAVSMALAFGAMLFFAFSWAVRFRAWTFPAGLFLGLSLAAGLFNRWMARRWYRTVEHWDAERRQAEKEIERLRAAKGMARDGG